MRSTVAPTGSAARASGAWPSSGAMPGRLALFPSGRGFGYIAYPPRTDGKDTYNEGYVFEGDGGLIPARVVRAPWLETLTPSGEDVSCVLETIHGTTVEITGETTASTFMVMPPDVGEGLRLQQTIVRYGWDGETGGRHARALDGHRARSAELTRRLLHYD